MSELDGTDVISVRSTDGTIGITGCGAVDLSALSVGAAGFGELAVDAPPKTGAPFTSLFSVTFTPTKAGTAIVLVRCTFVIVKAIGAGVDLGANFRLVQDGSIVAQSAWSNSFVAAGNQEGVQPTIYIQQAIAVGAAPTVLDLQWSAPDPALTLFCTPASDPTTAASFFVQALPIDLL